MYKEVYYIQCVSLPDQKACRRCRGHRDDLESNNNEELKLPKLLATVQRSREKEQKQ